MDIQKPPRRLLKAAEVAHQLSVDRRRVYGLPIPRIQLSEKCFRWQETDVAEFIRTRRSA
jgi:hypothetical protein